MWQEHVILVVSYLTKCHETVFAFQDALALGRPTETAVLLTLAGVRAVVLNQWSLSPADACEYSTSLFRSMDKDTHVAAALAKQRSNDANANARMRYNCIAYGIPFMKP